jgi:hypothetical protein
MWNPRRLVLNIKAICALAWLLGLVGLQALLRLNRRPPVIILPQSHIRGADPPSGRKLALSGEHNELAVARELSQDERRMVSGG